MRTPAFAHWQGDHLVLQIHVQPGAKKTALAGVHGEAFKIRVQAPPVEGAANQAVLDFLAAQFQIRRGQVRILRGENSREKQICVEGVLAADADPVLRAWQAGPVT